MTLPTTPQHRQDRLDTLEPRESIPAGTYAAYLQKVRILGLDAEHQGKKRWVYHLQDVPGWPHAAIDLGNFAGDLKLGYHNNLQGTITVGLGFENRIPGDGNVRAQLAILHSEIALARLVKHAQGAGIFVEIIDP